MGGCIVTNFKLMQKSLLYLKPSPRYGHLNLPSPGGLVSCFSFIFNEFMVLLSDAVKLAPLFCKSKVKGVNNSATKKEEVKSSKKKEEASFAKKADENVSTKRTLTDGEREFLMSTAPAFLKRCNSIKSVESVPLSESTFEKVVHVQQKDESVELWNLKFVNMKLRDGPKEISLPYNMAEKSFRRTNRAPSTMKKVGFAFYFYRAIVHEMSF